MEDWMKDPKGYIQSVTQVSYFKNIDDYKYQYLKDEDMYDQSFLPDQTSPRNLMQENEKNSIKFIHGSSSNQNIIIAKPEPKLPSNSRNQITRSVHVFNAKKTNFNKSSSLSS